MSIHYIINSADRPTNFRLLENKSTNIKGSALLSTKIFFSKRRVQLTSYDDRFQLIKVLRAQQMIVIFVLIDKSILTCIFTLLTHHDIKHTFYNDTKKKTKTRIYLIQCSAVVTPCESYHISVLYTRPENVLSIGG